MSAPLRFEEFDWERWQPVDVCSLVFIVDGVRAAAAGAGLRATPGARVLLIRKKRGLGAGKVNGPGGRCEAGETPDACGVREVREEVGLRVSALEPCGLLRFQFCDGYATKVHVLRTAHFTGTLMESDEAIPLWTDVARVPYEEMWADDRYWLPLVFEGARFEGNFLFDGDRLLGFDLDRL